MIAAAAVGQADLDGFSGHLADGVGLWRQVGVRPARTDPVPALFLDRDGVIVEEVGHLHRVADARLIEPIMNVIRRCNQREVPVVVVTNQSGVGRGLFDWRDFAAVQNWIVATLAAHAAHVDMVLACGYHDVALPPLNIGAHSWRKPAPGMLLEAAETLKIDLPRSWIVGDRGTDMEAGRAAGLAGGLHVRTGHGRHDVSAAKAVGTAGFNVRFGADVAAIMDLMPALAGADL